ncbi:MAG: 50S ribosomal protein L22 [Candidatus Gracilibacteria bacterium]
MKAIGRQLRITSKKLNLIADLIRNKEAQNALDILKFTPKKGARILRKIVHSAVANAENNFKQESGSLYVKEVIVTEGSTLKRSISISRGRVHPVLKRMAHATVILGVRDEAEGAKKSAKKTETVEAAPSEEPKKKALAKKTAPAKKPAAKKKGVTTVKA